MLRQPANRSLRKKGILIVFAASLVVLSLPVLGVVVNFPDPGLEAAIREAIEKPTGDIHDTDLVGLEELDASLRSISNLEGIQHCHDLTHLDLSENQISNLTPLAGLTALTELELKDNQISDLTPLAGLSALTWLRLALNQISDLTPLAGLSALTWLSLYYNQISDLAPLAGLTALTVLNLFHNEISDLTPLVGLTALTILYLHINEIVDISALAGLTNLTDLLLWTNQISDLAPLAGLTALVSLRMWSNQISDISVLVSNTGIDSGDTVDVSWNHLCLDPGSGDMDDINTLLGRGVNISYTPQHEVVDFPDLGLEAAIRDAIAKPTGDINNCDLDGLLTLDASHRSISNLEGIQHCHDLTALVLDGNQISDISPLAGLTSLETLMLDDNPISSFGPISGLIALELLTLNSDAITNLSFLSGLTNLTRLYLVENQIVDISPLSGLINLTQLSLGRNQIIDISALSGLTSLTHLYLHANQIADISVLSGLTNLVRLYLYSNQVVDLTPLVGNAGIGSGDDVDVRWNHLDLTPGSTDMQDINTLLGRGVGLEYDPQKTAAVFRVDDAGNVLADQTFHALAFETGEADIAEWVSVSEGVEPGDVLEFDPNGQNVYRRAANSYSSLVAGVVSTAPGVMLGGEGTEEQALLALTGIVPVKVTDEGGPIQAGDLLVTSSTPGHAMRWAGSEPCPCSLVGKALEPMTEDFGVILVLLTAH